MNEVDFGGLAGLGPYTLWRSSSPACSAPAVPRRTRSNSTSSSPESRKVCHGVEPPCRSGRPRGSVSCAPGPKWRGRHGFAGARSISRRSRRWNEWPRADITSERGKRFSGAQNFSRACPFRVTPPCSATRTFRRGRRVILLSCRSGLVVESDGALTKAVWVMAGNMGLELKLILEGDKPTRAALGVVARIVLVGKVNIETLVVLKPFVWDTELVANVARKMVFSEVLGELLVSIEALLAPGAPRVPIEACLWVAHSHVALVLRSLDWETLQLAGKHGLPRDAKAAELHAMLHAKVLLQCLDIRERCFAGHW
mmetsp:Transcript_9754/g.27591  ORF Transcript_9754/g.27591 Transcript_9754/m.27591 type:complete len:312 (-) Transcript_9754:111-1046(-)